jgi:dGTPase
VDKIEGLNLTMEVRDGIIKHSKRGGSILPDDKSLLPMTLEGQVVRIADSIAYLNHDLDDALRAKVISEADLDNEVKDILGALGRGHSERIGRMVNDVIKATMESGTERVSASDEVMHAAMSLRRFLDNRVYNGTAVHDDFKKASKIVKELFDYYISNPDLFYEDSGKNFNSGIIEQDVCDFISGMTDRYAFKEYERIFLPQPWLIF